ncbi:14939_t:CDS:2, partial [Racocetra persica]
DLKNFASDRDEIDPSRSEKEKLLYTKIVNQVIPYLEEVAKDKDREMEEKKRKATEREAQKEIERLRQLKAIEQMHNNVEILPTRTRVRRSKSTQQSTSITTTNNSNVDSHDSQSIVDTTKDSSNTVKAELKDSVSSSKKDDEDISSTSAKESSNDTVNKYNNDSMDNQSTSSKSVKHVSNKPKKNTKEKTSKSKKSSKDGSDETKKKNDARKNSKSAKKSAPIDTTIIESIPADYVKHNASSHENIHPDQDVPTGDSLVTENATYEHHELEHHELEPYRFDNIVIPEKTAFANDTTISSSPSKAVVCIGNQPIDNIKTNETLKTGSKGRGRPRKDKSAARAPYTKGGKGRGRQKKSTATDVSVRDGQDLGINKKGVPGEITFSISNSEGVQPWNSAPPTILNNTISTTTISDIVTNTSSDTSDKQFGVPSQNLNISGFDQSPNITGIANQVNVTVPTIDDNGTRSGEVVDSSQNINHSSNENSITTVFNAPTIETIADEVRLKSSKMTLDNLLTYEPNSGALHSEFLSTGNQAFTQTTNIPQNKSTTEIDHLEHPLITKIASLITPIETDTEITKVMENNSIDNGEPNESEEHNVNSDSNFWRTSVASLLNNEKIRDNDVGLAVPNGSTDHFSVTRSSVNSNIQPDKLSINTNIVDKQASKRHQTRSTRLNSQTKIVESINTSNVDVSDQSISISDNKKRRQPSDDLWYERPLTRNQAKAAAMNDTRLVDKVNGTKRKEEDRQQNGHELPERPKKRKRRFLTETDIDDSIGIFVTVDSKGNIDIIDDKEILSQPPPEGDAEKHIYFQPGPVGFLKLDTSLKHSFFQEDEVFGETDSELSSCGSVSSIDTD